jgi:hypothetical protein
MGQPQPITRRALMRGPDAARESDGSRGYAERGFLEPETVAAVRGQAPEDHHGLGSDRPQARTVTSAESPGSEHRLDGSKPEHTCETSQQTPNSGDVRTECPNNNLVEQTLTSVRTSIGVYRKIDESCCAKGTDHYADTSTQYFAKCSGWNGG